MQCGRYLEVLGSVIHQVDLLVPGAEEGPETAGIGAVVTAVVKYRFVFVPVDVHGIEAPRIEGVHLGCIHRIVIISDPIIRTETEGIDLESEDGIAFLILDVVRIAESGLRQVPFAHLGADRHPGKPKRRLGLHRDDTVESARTIEGTARTRHDVHLHDIEIRGPQKIAQREVQSRALVVHPIDQLQGTHGRRAVEAPGIDDLESQGCTGQVHTLQIAQTFIEVATWRLLDGQHIHALDRQGPLFLALINPGPHHFGLLHQHGIRLEHGSDLIRRAAHVNRKHGIPDESDVQPNRNRGHLQPEASIEIRRSTRSTPFDQHACRKDRIPCLTVNDLPPDDFLG